MYLCVTIVVDDFNMQAVELEFAPNQTEISFSIQTLSDFLLEVNEEFVVRIAVTDSSKIIGVKLNESSTSSANVAIISTNGNSVYMCTSIQNSCLQRSLWG